ncbi:GNAT family N-acetyltransferase [Microcoleus sp. B5-D4]|uniref:GNAT family N-acetyltransferase n=1 Tax=unclassified Microcoleus TaxID=2642155 RepID=UPI002FD5581B
MLALNRIDNHLTGFAYQAFTFPRFRYRLQVLKPEGSTVAIAASDSNEPVGLALADILPDGKAGEVLSIFVEKKYRNLGVGTSLLARLEEELLSRGCASVNLVYTTGQPTTLALENLLQKCNWTPPQPRMIVCKSTTDKIANAPWMQKATLPAAYTIFPWVEITAEERILIKQQQAAAPWIPPQLIPFENEENFEPLNSVGLRYRGQVVGWVITHRIAPDTIRYTCSFVRQDLQKMGRIIPLYVRAIKIQEQAGIPKGIWTVPFVYTSMVSFVKKRMASYMISIDESRGSFKSLGDGGTNVFLEGRV